jgi:POT family proton-dependent oligopeptide transporter
MTVPRPSTSDLFGHPRGLMVLATTEMWERFSFYGMQALLLLYMTKYLLLPEHARDVLGLAAFRAALTSVVGPMTDLAFAAQTYGLYSGLIYGTPLVGAWLGDRVLGKTRTVTGGCLLMSAGHLAMASEHFFLVALLLIIVGAGGVIGNMAAQVGKLYDADDHRRTRAFGIYLITLNIGALVAPLVIGTLGEKIGWHWGFGAAGVGMLIGLATYLAGRRYLPPDVITKRSASQKLTRAERKTVLAIFLALVPYILYGTAAQQAYAIMYVWADTAVDRVFFGWEVPVTWIGIADGFLTILGVLVANRVWIALNKRNREPGDLTKMMVGYLLVGLAYVFAAGVATMAVVPVILWVFFYFVMDQGVGWVEAPMQSLISRDAAPSVNATMMAVFKAATMVSYFLVGWTGRFYEPLGASMFFVLNAALSIVALGMVVVGRSWLLRMLGGDVGDTEDVALVKS